MIVQRKSIGTLLDPDFWPAIPVQWAEVAAMENFDKASPLAISLKRRGGRGSRENGKGRTHALD